MITIQKSSTADTRTCDVTKVTEQILIDSTKQHIQDVQFALAMFRHMLVESAMKHDETKLSEMKQFYSDFKTSFKEHTWWDGHRAKERHHLQTEDGVREDVNLVDVLEFISDCVMAGMARTGSVYELKLSDQVLQKAFKNTVDLLKGQVEVK